MKTKIFAVSLVLIALLAGFAVTASAGERVGVKAGVSHEQLTDLGYVKLPTIPIPTQYLVGVFQIKQNSPYNLNEYISFFIDVNQDGIYSDLEYVPAAGNCAQFISDPTGASVGAPINYACFNIIPAGWPLNIGSNYNVRGVLSAGVGPITDPRTNPVYGNVIHRTIHITP